MTRVLEMSQLYLGVLARDGVHTFQTLSDTHDLYKKRRNGSPYDPNAKILHGTFDQLKTALVRANDQGAGVFAMVSRGDGRGRTSRNVVGVRALFCDFDGSALPSDFPLEPHLIVESSPGRWHIYWLVRDLNLNDFAPMQAALAAYYGTDTAVIDLPRLMRVPGFYHLKSEQFVVRLVKARAGSDYDRHTILTAWPQMSKALAERDTSERALVKREGRIWIPLSQDIGRNQMDLILQGHCKRVAESKEGTRHLTLRKASRTLGGYVGGGYLDFGRASAELLEAAETCGLPYAEAASTIRWGLDHGVLKPLTLENRTLLSHAAARNGKPLLSYRTRVLNRIREWKRDA